MNTRIEGGLRGAEGGIETPAALSMNRSAELQLRQVRRAKDTLIAPGWSPALQFRGSWSQCMRKSEWRLFMNLVLPLLFLFWAASVGRASDVAAAFEQANKLYELGKYPEA